MTTFEKLQQAIKYQRKPKQELTISGVIKGAKPRLLKNGKTRVYAILVVEYPDKSVDYLNIDLSEINDYLKSANIREVSTGDIIEITGIYKEQIITDYTNPEKKYNKKFLKFISKVEVHDRLLPS